MQLATTRLIEKLLQVARSLPGDQLAEVVDFAGYLQQRQPTDQRPARGSAAAVLAHVGRLQFAPGELDRLNADITGLRDMDLVSDA